MSTESFGKLVVNFPKDPRESSESWGCYLKKVGHTQAQSKALMLVGSKRRGVCAGAKLLALIAPLKNAIQIGAASVVSSELPRIAEGEILEAAPNKHHHGHFVGLTCQM